MRRACLLLAMGLGACAAPPPAPPPIEPPAASFAEPPALDSLFGAEYDRALAAIGLDRASARCTLSDLSLTGVGRFRLPLWDALMEDPTLTDRYARTFREGAFASARSLEASSMFAAGRLGVAVRISMLADPLAAEMAEAAKPEALAAALRAMGMPEPPSASAVPPHVQVAAALVLRAEARARAWIDRAFEACPDPGDIRSRRGSDATLLLAEDSDDLALRMLLEQGAEAVDLHYLARAAAEVEIATDRAAELLAAAKPAGPFAWSCETPEGTVQLRGDGDDVDSALETTERYALRLDTGGNDRYAAGGSATPDCTVAVLLDLAGADVYEGRTGAAAFGAGFGGVGLLLDLAGNDRYELKGTRSLGLGAGVFGVGALRDAGGDDAYVGDGFCMGAGAVGWGTLADGGGTDRYEAGAFAQGFGFVLGAGVLSDLSGNDEYVLVDGQGRRPSAQSKEHDTSLGQGFGFGVRADYIDGHSLAGGVGILADREGDDRYSCGVFGQGGGYWMGVGMLLDGAGRDEYRGAWYVQGACAHFAVGLLEDAAGDDVYDASLNMAQGAGHDYSLGVLIDRAGNDVHRAPNLSLGGGNSNGVGILVDGGGDDSWRSRDNTLGLAAMEAGPEVPTLRHGSLTLGVFLDLGGKDVYLQADGSAAPFAGDGRTWTQPERARKPIFSNTRGVGADR